LLSYPFSGSTLRFCGLPNQTRLSSGI
jgi:hypothetical protein